MHVGEEERRRKDCGEEVEMLGEEDVGKVAA